MSDNSLDETYTALLGKLAGSIGVMHKEVKQLPDSLKAVVDQVGQATALITERATELSKVAATTTEMYDKHIQELLVSGKTQLENVTKSQVEVFVKAARARTEAEMQAIRLIAQEEAIALLKGVGHEATAIVRTQFSTENVSLSAATKKFSDVTEKFEQAMIKQHKAAATSVIEFDIALKESAEKHKGMGWLGQIGLFIGGAIVCSLASIVVLSYEVNHGLILIPTANQVK